MLLRALRSTRRNVSALVGRQHFDTCYVAFLLVILAPNLVLSSHIVLSSYMSPNLVLSSHIVLSSHVSYGVHSL